MQIGLSDYMQILCADVVEYIALIYVPLAWEDKVQPAKDTMLYLKSFGLCGSVDTEKKWKFEEPEKCP